MRACVFSYLLQTEYQNPHSTVKVRTLSEAILVNPPNFKGLLEGKLGWLVLG